MSFILLLTRAQKLESGLNAGRQRAAACLFLDLQQQQRMLKIWMLWLPIADMMAARPQCSKLSRQGILLV
jgi:hypothetical protein